MPLLVVHDVTVTPTNFLYYSYSAIVRYSADVYCWTITGRFWTVLTAAPFPRRPHEPHHVRLFLATEIQYCSLKCTRWYVPSDKTPTSYIVRVKLDISLGRAEHHLSDVRFDRDGWVNASVRQNVATDALDRISRHVEPDEISYAAVVTGQLRSSLRRHIIPSHAGNILNWMIPPTQKRGRSGMNEFRHTTGLSGFCCRSVCYLVFTLISKGAINVDRRWQTAAALL